MQDVSPAARLAMTTSHSIVVQVDAYYNGALTVADLPISDGSVTVDRGSKIRRSLSLTIADPKLLPWDATDTLAVYGQELRVRRGIRFPNGSTEMWELGTFRIDEPAGDVHLGPVTLTGKSREGAIIDDKFIVPTSTAGQTTCVQAIEYLVHQTQPAATIVNQTHDARNPVVAVATWDANADRWDAVIQIATAMNAEIYVDELDRFVIRDIPDVLNDPVVWEIAEGEVGTLMTADRSMSRANVCNAVVVSGENAATGTAPISAVAYDNDPNSPTRWDGPFGHVAKMYSSALITGAGQAQVTANAMLFDATAPNVQTSVTTVPIPALEAGDVLRVVAVGRKELSIAQSFSVPLTAEGTFPLALRGAKEEDAA